MGSPSLRASSIWSSFCEDRLNGRILGKLFRQIGQRFASTLMLVGCNHAFGHAGKRLGIFRIGLHHSAVKLRSTVDIARRQKPRRLLEHRFDFGCLIGTGRTGEAVDELANLAFRYRTHEAVGGTAADEGDDSRDRLDAELACDRRMVVDVHLHELDAALSFVDHLFQDRRQLLARTAPGRPEIDKHGLIARLLDDVLRESWRSSCP